VSALYLMKRDGTNIAAVPIYTYIAGCTDPAYKHQSCPNKSNYTDYQWVGLVFCGNGQNYWVGCENDGSAFPSVSEESSDCTCNLNIEGHDAPLFQASRDMVALGYLPTSKGEKIKWESGWGPVYDTAASSLIGSTASSSSSISIKTVPPPTIGASDTITSSQSRSAETTSFETFITTDPPAKATASRTTTASGSENLSTGQKAGIGVSVAAISIISLSFILFAVRRWHKKRKENTRKGLKSVGGGFDKPHEGKPTIPDVGEPELRSPAWSGHKSELPGSPPNAIMADQTLDTASTIVHSPSWSSMVDASPKQSSEQPVYRPFRYQPSIALEGIQEVPDHERPRWAQTDYGTYGPDRGYSIEHSRAAQGSTNDGYASGSNNVHELPG